MKIVTFDESKFVLVPVEPTETMVVCGFESRPDPVFSKPDEWEAFEAMTGCQQAAHKARLCYAAMLAAAPTPPANAQPARDWELTCDHCDGSGHVFVERQVAERKTDVQEFKDECECCEGRGFVFAFEDIPGIAEYVRKSRPVPASAQGDAQQRLSLGVVLGLGEYLIQTTACGEPAQIVFSQASDHDRATRTIGDLKVCGHGPFDHSRIRGQIMFTSAAGLDALEVQLRELRKEHWPETMAAAPAAGDALDAARWRAFIGCARIRPLGSSGLEQPDPNNYAHMGLEIWTVYGRDYSPELLKRMDAENERGRRWLVMFADVARAALAAQVPHKGDAA